jgi:hypothetical protein
MTPAHFRAAEMVKTVSRPAVRRQIREPGQHYLCPSYQDFFRHIGNRCRSCASCCGPAGHRPS